MHVTFLKAPFTPPLPPEMYKTTDSIFTFNYIQTEYINMEIKQSNSKNSKGQIIIYIGPKVDGTNYLLTKMKTTNTGWTKMHRTN